MDNIYNFNFEDTTDLETIEILNLFLAYHILNDEITDFYNRYMRPRAA